MNRIPSGSGSSTPAYTPSPPQPTSASPEMSHPPATGNHRQSSPRASSLPAAASPPSAVKQSKTLSVVPRKNHAREKRQTNKRNSHRNQAQPSTHIHLATPQPTKNQNDDVTLERDRETQSRSPCLRTPGRQSPATIGWRRSLWNEPASKGLAAARFRTAILDFGQRPHSRNRTMSLFHCNQSY